MVEAVNLMAKTEGILLDPSFAQKKVVLVTPDDFFQTRIMEPGG